MAAELAEAIATGEPERRRELSNGVLDRYKGHFKLGTAGLDPVLKRSLEKVEDYARAVGWVLEPAMAARLAVPEEASPAVSGEDNTDETLRTVMHPEPNTAVAALVPPARPREDILSGGIQDITHALVEGRSLSDILRIVIETLCTGTGCEHAILALRDPKQGVMSGRFGLGQGVEPKLPRFRFPLAYAPDAFHIALEKNTDVLYLDTRDPRVAAQIPAWYRKDFDARTFMLFPIVVKDKPFGLIYAGSSAPGAIQLGEREMKLLHTLRNQAVLAIRQAT